VTVRCLSLHAAYRCQDRGACCTAGWPIPVEADRLAGMQAAVAEHALQARTGRTFWMAPADAPPATPGLLDHDDRGCVFFDRRAGAHCRVQHALGHEALPLACRQFPRVSVIDPRGASVTLSHYCPTAAALLDDAPPIAIVSDAPSFPPRTELVGLDTRAQLPPLLRPDMLMAWDAWWEWERLSVGLIADVGTAPADALARLATIVRNTSAWSPADGDLIAWIHRAFEQGGEPSPACRIDASRRVGEVLEAIPDDLRPASFDTANPPTINATRGLLASHAFANWTAHLGEGLEAWLRSLEAVWALLDRGLGVRQTDLLVRHLADPHRLAAIWSRPS